MNIEAIRKELATIRKEASTSSKEVLSRLLELESESKALGDAHLIYEVSYLIVRTEVQLGGSPQTLERISWSLDFLKKNLPDQLISQFDLRILEGIVHFRKLDFDKAFETTLQTEALAKAIGSASTLFRSKNLLGVVRKRQLKYGAAFRLFKECLDICKTDIADPNLLEGLATSNNNLGTIFIELQEHQRAIPYYKKTIEINETLQKEQNQAVGLFNVALAYFNLQSYQEAIPYIKKSIHLSSGVANNTLVAALYLLSELKYQTGQYKKAEELSAEVKEKCESLQMESFFYFEACGTLMKCKNRKKQYEEAIEIGEMALKKLGAVTKSESTYTLELQRQIHDHLFDAFESSGQEKKALDIAKRLLQLTEILHTKKSEFQVFKSQAQFEIQQRDLQLQHQKELIERETAHNERLSSLNRQLDEFTRIISHDLKSPVRTIRSFGQLLQRQLSLEGGHGEMIQHMVEASGNLSVMIDDLLHYAKAGRFEHPDQPVPLEEVLTQVIRNLNSQIKEAKAVIEHHPLPVVKGVNSALVQVFQNLLENALKFRHPGRSPHIQIRPIDAVEEANRVVVSIKDNGIGMASEKLDFVFQPFWQGEDSQRYGGTGIGLATCLKIVRELGGDITVASEDGKGTEFMIYFVKDIAVA